MISIIVSNEWVTQAVIGQGSIRPHHHNAIHAGIQNIGIDRLGVPFQGRFVVARIVESIAAIGHAGNAIGAIAHTAIGHIEVERRCIHRINSPGERGSLLGRRFSLSIGGKCSGSQQDEHTEQRAQNPGNFAAPPVLHPIKRNH